MQEVEDRESRAVGRDSGMSEVASLFGEQGFPGGIRLGAILRKSTIVYKGMLLLSEIHCDHGENSTSNTPDGQKYLHEGMLDVIGILADERPRKKLVKENARMARTMRTDGRPVFLGCGAELPSSRAYGERENHFIVALEEPRKYK